MTNLICQFLYAFPFRRMERLGVIQENSTSNRRDKPRFPYFGIGLNERQAFDELILIKNNFYTKAKTNSSPWKCWIGVLAVQWAREPIIVSKQGPSHRIVATNYHYANHCKAGWTGKIHVYLISKLTTGHLGNSLLQRTKNALVL